MREEGEVKPGNINTYSKTLIDGFDIVRAQVTTMSARINSNVVIIFFKCITVGFYLIIMIISFGNTIGLFVHSLACCSDSPIMLHSCQILKKCPVFEG